MASNQKTSASAKRSRLMNIGILLFILGVATVLVSKIVQSNIRHSVASGEIDEEGTERARQARPMTKTTVKQSELQALDNFEYVGYGFAAIGGLIILVNGLKRGEDN